MTRCEIVCAMLSSFVCFSLSAAGFLKIGRTVCSEQTIAPLCLSKVVVSVSVLSWFVGFSMFVFLIALIG